MSERHIVTPAVFTVVRDRENVLLHRRMGTGYRDGQYDVASGHLEPGETPLNGAIRELKEEYGLEADSSEMELFHLVTNEVDTPERPYFYMFFRIGYAACIGAYSIQEPHKCDDMGMFSINELPFVVPHVELALREIDTKIVTFSKM